MHEVDAEMTNLLIFLSNPKKIFSNKKCETETKAKKRWRILACALLKKNLIYNNASIRVFDGYGIMEQKKLEVMPLMENEQSYTYTIKCKNKKFDINLVEFSHFWSPNDLSGYDNTGNVCIWPSEETLSYYVLKHLEDFKNAWILEIGGGMSCLASLLIAKHGEPFLVHLSDGNPKCIKNVEKTIKINNFKCFIKCSVLEWENCVHSDETPGKYNFILSADCLFFAKSHASLLQTLQFYLSETGKALVMAPQRKNTFQDFCNLSASYGFTGTVIKHYSNHIWQKHLNLLNTQNYDEDVHYPQLLILERQNSMNYQKK